MAVNILKYIGGVLKHNNVYFDTYGVNGLQLKTGEVISFDDNGEKKYIGVSDNVGTSFYIRSEPKITYETTDRKMSSLRKINNAIKTCRLVAFSFKADEKINSEILVNKLVNDLTLIKFTGLDINKPEITIKGSNASCIDNFVNELKKEDATDIPNFICISIDFELRYYDPSCNDCDVNSMPDECFDYEEIPRPTHDICTEISDCEIIININSTLANLQYQIDNLPGGGLTCETLEDCTIIGNINKTLNDLQTEIDDLVIPTCETIANCSFVNDIYDTINYVTALIPTNISQLNNNTGFITISDVPSNLSYYTNDIGYITTIAGIGASGELAGNYPNPTLVNNAVIGKVLTGYISGAGIISATDTILQAIQKLNGNITTVSSSYVPYSGANANLNMGVYGLTANTVTLTGGKLSVAASTLLYPAINFTTGGLDPTTLLNGDVYYTITNGFTFYSNDPTNVGDIVHFTNGHNTLALYSDSANDLYLYAVSSTSNLTLSVNGGNIPNYQIDADGSQSWINAPISGGISKAAFRFTGSAKTNQTASVLQSAFVFTPGSIQFATGAMALQKAIQFAQQTVSFVGASTLTLSATVGIGGAIISGTNATQITTCGLLIQSIAVGTATTSYGILSNAMTGATNNYAAGFSGNVQITLGRILNTQSTSIASTNNLILGLGNAFEITGATQINLISNIAWQNGSIITLLFTASLTVKNNQTTSTTNITIQLAGGVDFSATANDTLTLILSTIGGVQAWREISRAII